MADILYLTAVLNSCINPLIYGAYYYQEKRGRDAANSTSYRWDNRHGAYYYQERRGMNAAILVHSYRWDNRHGAYYYQERRGMNAAILVVTGGTIDMVLIIIRR